MFYRKSAKERLIDALNDLLILLLSISILYPMYYVLINSINDNLAFGPAYLTLKNVTMTYYKFLFRDSYLFNAFFVSISRTVIGVITNIFLMAMCAYALRKKKLVLRGLYLALFTIPMFFDGGLIPKYLVLKNLGLLDNFLVYILPNAIRFFIVIIFMSGFNDIPDAIEESATIDGANDFTIFLKFYMHLALPVVATMSLFVAVDHWNSWTDSVYFVSDRKLHTLQTVLMKLVKESNVQDYAADMQQETQFTLNPDGIKFATIIVTMLPITIVYPFLQKYFIKGITVGSVKG